MAVVTLTKDGPVVRLEPKDYPAVDALVAAHYSRMGKASQAKRKSKGAS